MTNGILPDTRTLADQVGACAVALKPIHSLIEEHVLAAERLHNDDTSVPILTKGKTDTGRIWTYVGDYVHLVIMRRLLRQEALTVRFSDDFRLANCA